MLKTKTLIELPIDNHIKSIVSTFRQHDNLILTASPGSGKTTRLPPALMQLPELNNKKIIVLVPKRIAAIGAAARVADEQDFALGQQIGYQVRFDNNTKPNSQLIYMTEGVFLKKINDVHFFKNIGVIIFDEFHERSSQIDLALGICLEKQILGEPIKLIVMSATLNADKLLKYLPNSTLIEIENKPFPLTIIKSKKSQRLSCDQIFADHLLETLQIALSKAEQDILVFLPGLAEMRFLEKQITRKFSGWEIHILHGSTQLEEQRKILAAHSHKRIILATNIAESSITIPTVDVVIDSGLVKKSVTENKIGFKRLELARISQFSATQRAGRAARVKSGVCYQLWHELDERSMPIQIEPEILTSDLLSETLTLLSLGLSDPQHFSWLDQPKKSFKAIVEQLKKWNLIDQQNKITSTGYLVQSCPLDIEKSFLFIALAQIGYQKAAARFLAYIETGAYEKHTENADLNQLFLTDVGKKIENQLLLVNIPILSKHEDVGTLKETLIKIFFTYFPHKIAQKKEKNLAISSLGRGVELAANLIQPTHQYYLLLAGREASNALTKAEFAIGFTQSEFETLSQSYIKLNKEIHFDKENKKLYKIEKKQAGLFVLSESPKIYLDDKNNHEDFIVFLNTNFNELLIEHPHYLVYLQKINFLNRKAFELQLKEEDFKFLEQIPENLQKIFDLNLNSIDGFYNQDLNYLLKELTPHHIQQLLEQMPPQYSLANGKSFAIDYTSEQAPKISARLQEFYNQKTNPTLFNGKMRITLELLAPNYRPTQVTSQLENFWKSSYHEIKKELKARYPKHFWPDDPSNCVIPIKIKK